MARRHLAPTDTLDQIGRGHGVEGHEHVDCNAGGLSCRPSADAAVDVLMPFHSMTTTDLVESISGGLVRSPSKVLNPPSSSLKDAGGRV